MSNWIDRYKQLLCSSSRPHTIIADRDGLFAYDELRNSVSADGYRLSKAKDSLDVRVQFELEVRESEEHYIIVAPGNYEPLPDMLQLAHFTAAGLRDLFPKLDAQSLQGLGFNELCTLSNIRNYAELGQDGTLRFLLENLYSVDFNSIRTHRKKEGILSALISVMLEGEGVNPPLVESLQSMAKPYFPELVRSGLSKDTLIILLQHLWQEWVGGNEGAVDFSWPGLSKTIGNLVIQRHLTPVPVTQERYEATPRALRIGLAYDTAGAVFEQLQSQLAYLEEQVTQIQDVHEDWHRIIMLAAGIMANAIAFDNQQLLEDLKRTIGKTNDRFQRYLDNCYNNMFTLSGTRKPYVVTRILDHIYAQPQAKKALIVIDGIAFWQWNIIAQALHDAGISVRTSATLAFIPSITAWSRQAIFRGERPDINTDNSKEAVLFADYWQERGFKKGQIHYEKFSAHKPLNVEELSPTKTILGLVCNDLDDIAHGTILGIPQLYAATQQWIKTSGFIELVNSLKSKGFALFITTDHGNIAATGVGALGVADKVGALSRSKRHVKFSNEILRDSFVRQYPALALGVKDLSIYFRDESAFKTEGVPEITHGGSHLWEVMIPFAVL